ncbi:MAG: Crp/Fnr family transcriptional regulator [Bacteroidota bacterium]
MEKLMDIGATQLNDFKALSSEDKLKLWEACEFVKLPKGAVVFNEDEALNKLFCIRKGACKFSKMDPNGKEYILRFLGKGEIMGKRALVTENGARVSATTLTETELCCLEKHMVLYHLEHNTQFCKDFLKALIEDNNINEHTRIIFNLNCGMQERMAHLLLYLADKYGTDVKGRLLVRVKREDMAAVLGTSPEYVINILKKFRLKKVIEILRGEIYIPSKEGLRNSSCS